MAKKKKKKTCLISHVNNDAKKILNFKFFRDDSIVMKADYPGNASTRALDKTKFKFKGKKITC